MFKIGELLFWQRFLPR